MSDWLVEFFDMEKEEWHPWQTGVFDECLEEFMRHKWGDYSSRWTRARLVGPERVR